MEVGQEDLLELQQPDRAQQLTLAPFPAVDQDAIAPAADQQACRRTLDRRHRAGGPQEENGQIHGSIIFAHALAGLNLAREV